MTRTPARRAAVFGTLALLCSLGTAQAQTPSAAEQACLQAVAAMVNNSVVLFTSAARGADTLVLIGVGEDKAPWQCIAHEDGSTDELMFLGTEGD